MYLHELHRIMREAPADESGERRKRNGFGKKALPPEMSVTVDDGFDIILINGRVAAAYRIAVRTVLVCADNFMLVCRGDAAVGNKRRYEYGMGSATLGTLYTAYAE